MEDNGWTYYRKGLRFEQVSPLYTAKMSYCPNCGTKFKWIKRDDIHFKFDTETGEKIEAQRLMCPRLTSRLFSTWRSCVETMFVRTRRI